MDTSEQLFAKGFNCAQSVLLANKPQSLTIDKNLLALSSPYGGGLAGTDSLCGAVTGGAMAIGLHYGHTSADDVDSKMLTKAKTQEFIEAFKQKHGNLNCSSLIKYNLSVPEEAKAADEAGVFKSICPQLVGSASEILKEIL